MNMHRWLQLCAHGDGLLHSLGVRTNMVEGERWTPGETVRRSVFDDAFEAYCEKHGIEDSEDLAVLHRYAEAGAGLARKKRARLLVWLDHDGTVRFQPPPWIGAPGPMPNLEHQLTETAEQVLQEVLSW